MVLPRKTAAFALFFSSLSYGCSGAETAKPASGERSVEIIHESCDIDAASAVRTDVNGDGSPDIVRVMKGDREVCRVIDLNFDKVKDAFIYYDDAGQERRRESDFDKDGRPDVIATLQGGVVVSKELETNFDMKLDTWETYAGGRLTKTERDGDADGIIDEWWDFNRPDQPKCAVVIKDKNADGEPDPDTAVDMCGEGYKPPAPPMVPIPATPSGTASGSFGPTPPATATAATASATTSASAPAPTPSATATGKAAPPPKPESPKKGSP